MATHITPSTDSQRATTTAPSDRLVRASIAAGFAMAEGLPDDPVRDETEQPEHESALRRTWHTFEHYLAHFLTWSHARHTGIGAWQQ